MLIETKKLTKKYENAKNLIAVDQAEICVDHGETVGLFGESGSGKSTLGLMLAGLERPTFGEIFFEEKTLGNALSWYGAQKDTDFVSASGNFI